MNVNVNLVPGETEISYSALLELIMCGSLWVFTPFNWKFVC